MRLFPEGAKPRPLSGLAAGVGVLALGAVFELVGRALFPPLRAVGVLLAFVGLGVFLVAGVWYLLGYVQQFLP